MVVFVYEPAVEAFWAWLRYMDNRRKHKPLTPPWDYIWAMVVYGVINGHVHLSDIEREWREGTPYAYRGKQRLNPAYEEEVEYGRQEQVTATSGSQKA